MSQQHQVTSKENACMVMSMSAHNNSPSMTGARCSYTSCLGGHPPNFLEQNSGMAANGGEDGTSTTAGVGGGWRPITNKANTSSTSNADRTTNEKGSTPCIKSTNNGFSFTDDNSKNSNTNNSNTMKNKESKLPAQKGFSKCSCILPPHVFLYNQLCAGKGIEITERIEYDKSYKKLLIYSTEVTGIQTMKSFLKRTIARADKEAKETNSTVDILSIKKSDGCSSLYSGVIRYTSDDDNSNNGSKPDIKYSAFANDYSEYAEDIMKVDNEGETDFMGEEWEWNNWAPHDIPQEIPGPKFPERYNGPHRLGDGVEHFLPLHYNV
eukprot:15365418-Ditylum_brightwellii.AAC.1